MRSHTEEDSAADTMTEYRENRDCHRTGLDALPGPPRLVDRPNHIHSPQKDGRERGIVG